MSLLEGRVGIPPTSEGVVAPVRLGMRGELVVGLAHGRSREGVSRGAVFHAAMQAGAALGTALTAAATTLTIYNPIGSGVVLSVLHVSAGLTAVPAGNAALVYAVSVNPLAAAPVPGVLATVRSNRLGPSGGRGVAYTACTLPAVPVVARVLGNVSVSTSAAQILDEVQGMLELPENTALTVQGLGAAATGLIAVTWEEIPE